MRNDDADRARERGRLGEDHVLTAAVGHRDIVAATGRDAAHAHHHRQVAFLGQFGQSVVKLIAAADRATRGIDAEHDRLDALVVRDVVELRTGEAAAPHDGAGDVDDRHLGGRHPREGVVFLHHLCIALEILRRGTGAGQRRQQRNACDRPGDPGAPAAPEAALFQDHSCGWRRWHLFDLHDGTPAGGSGEGKRQFAIFPRIPLPLNPWHSRFSGTMVPRGRVDRLHQRREPCERRVATCLCVSAPSVFPICHWRRRWSGWRNSSSRPWRSMSTRVAPTSSPAMSRPITRRRSRPAAICSGCGPWRSRSRLPRHPNSTTASRRAADWPSRSPWSPWWSMPRNSAPPSTGRSSGCGRWWQSPRGWGSWSA